MIGMVRRDMVQRARLAALTRAAYGTGDGVAAWDLDPSDDGDGTDRGGSADTDPTGRRRRRAGRSAGPRRRPFTARTALALVLAAVAVLAVVLVRSAATSVATTVLPDAANASATAAVPDVTAEGAPTQDAGPGSAQGSAPPAGAADAMPSTAASPTPSGVVVVHVAGEVLAPGVVTLPVGSRVQDAVAAAGGATATADLDAVNLARLLVDGERVLIPAPGEAVTEPDVPGTGSGSGPGPAASGGAGSGGLVNLNTADATTLEELPGIGPALAARIIAWREQHGGFTAVAELDEVSGIGPALMAQLTPLVTT